MFTPPLFAEDRIEVMQDLIAAHPFATLVAAVDGALSADHVPLVLDLVDGAADGAAVSLTGHLAAANPLARHDGPLEVLAVFQGPQAYVTPSWYPSKQEHGKVVPTWNYAVVHAHGQMVFHRDPAWLRTHLDRLTDHTERPRTAPWAVADAPEPFVARQIKGIVGIEIRITALTGKWKVSQNKPPADRAGVAEGLRQEPGAQAAAMADLVRREG
ncbi:MAG: FMN-binding negative transcriptional regulator [Pseudomonadota bacterium]